MSAQSLSVSCFVCAEPVCTVFCLCGIHFMTGEALRTDFLRELRGEIWNAYAS